MPRWVFFFIAACIILYMVFDALDGLRARKFKKCSPLGRIIDEAGDSMQYGFIGILLGFVIPLEPGWFCLGYCLFNLPQYFVEVSYLQTGMRLHGGDIIGAIEYNLLMAFIFIVAGVYGVENVNDQASFLPKQIPLSYAQFFSLVFAYIILDATWNLGIKPSLEKNITGTLINSIPIMIVFAIIAIQIMIGSPTFQNKFVVFHMLHVFTFNVNVFRLQISNMVKTQIRALHFEHVIQAIPIFVHLTLGKDYEISASMVCAFLQCMLFYAHMGMLVRQYMLKNPKYCLLIFSDDDMKDI